MIKINASVDGYKYVQRFNNLVQCLQDGSDYQGSDYNIPKLIVHAILVVFKVFQCAWQTINTILRFKL